MWDITRNPSAPLYHPSEGVSVVAQTSEGACVAAQTSDTARIQAVAFLPRVQQNVPTCRDVLWLLSSRAGMQHAAVGDGAPRCHVCPSITKNIGAIVSVNP